MQLSQIKISNFRNFGETTINLKEGINVIIGPNNAGKTNFLKVVGFLNKRDKLKLSDFNYNNLFDKQISDYKDNPPKVEFYYAVEHSFNSSEIDSAIIKLKNFIVYESDGNFLKEEGNNSYKIKGAFKIAFELNDMFKEEYKSKIAEMQEGCTPEERFKDFESILEYFIEKYEWNYYNSSGEYAINASDIDGIFNMDFIPADRSTDKLLPETKRFVKKKIDEQDGIRLGIKNDISGILADKLLTITNDIKTKFAEGQESIGITKGNNILEPSFKYNAQIDEHFQFHLIDKDKKYNLPLENNGLGYNNLIQIYNIIKFKISDDYNILLIEEPESHLHPAMQYQLFKYLQNLEEQAEEKIKNQIIITTHSPNISASSNIDDVITLHYYRSDGNCCVVAENLKNKFISDDATKQKSLNANKNHLKKFLDITRSDMLFTERVILVEGLAEKLLLPMFAVKEEIDLINNHIAIVEVGGINFNHFLPIFKNTKNKILCIRDCDFSYQNDDGKIDISHYAECSSKNLISEEYSGNSDTIKAITQKNGGSTFENELFIDNFTKNEVDSKIDTTCKKLLSFVLPDSIKDTNLLKNLSLDYWHSNINLIKRADTKKKVSAIMSSYKELFDSATKDAEKQKISCLFFANLFLLYGETQKGNLALNILMREWESDIITPEYIKEGLLWIK